MSDRQLPPRISGSQPLLSVLAEDPDVLPRYAAMTSIIRSPLRDDDEQLDIVDGATPGSLEQASQRCAERTRREPRT